MSYYTPEQRRRGLATRRRNARLRREEDAKKGIKLNPTIKLSDDVIVTGAVNRRLTKKAKSNNPIIGVIASIWVLTFFIMSRFPASPWSWLGVLVALVFTIFVLYKRRAAIETETIQLAEERKKRLDEAKQFYSSPEWQQVRSEVIKEKGQVCSECGVYYEDSYHITVDHIRPRSKYPELALELSNLRVLCRRCNSSKGDKDSEIYYR